jgi:hypothetical protein
MIVKNSENEHRKGRQVSKNKQKVKAVNNKRFV